MNIRIKPIKPITYEGRIVVELICKELQSERDARIARMMKGSNHNRMSVMATSVDDNKSTIYNSMTEAGNILNIDPSQISKACRKPNATAGGFYWKKIKDL